MCVFNLHTFTSVHRLWSAAIHNNARPYVILFWCPWVVIIYGSSLLWNLFGLSTDLILVVAFDMLHNSDGTICKFQCLNKVWCFIYVTLYHKPLVKSAKMILRYMPKCDSKVHWNVHILGNSNYHNFTSWCAVKSNHSSFSLEHKVSNFAIKPNWSGADFTRGLWYRATYWCGFAQRNLNEIENCKWLHRSCENIC